MNKKIGLIIIVQSLLVIALFWTLVFYGKDEYEDLPIRTRRRD